MTNSTRQQKRQRVLPGQTIVHSAQTRHEHPQASPYHFGARLQEKANGHDDKSPRKRSAQEHHGNDSGRKKHEGYSQKGRVQRPEQRKTHHHSYADRPVGTGRLWRQHPGHKEVRHERDQTRESVDEQVLGSKYCCQYLIHDRSSPAPSCPSHSGTWSITVVLAIPSSTWAVRAPP